MHKNKVVANIRNCNDDILKISFAKVGGNNQSKKNIQIAEKIRTYVKYLPWFFCDSCNSL